MSQLMGPICPSCGEGNGHKVTCTRDAMTDRDAARLEALGVEREKLESIAVCLDAARDALHIAKVNIDGIAAEVRRMREWVDAETKALETKR